MWRFLVRMLDDVSAEAWEIIVALVLCVIFPALTALLLWHVGRGATAFRLAKGYCILWLALLVAYALATFIQKRFRVDLYTHPDAFLASNILVGGTLVTGWSAFAALIVRASASDAATWLAVALYIAGTLSCVVACMVVGSFYRGHIYKLFNLAVACAGFLIFSVWPAAGRGVFGRFFDIF
ncbi:MAG: hypothetical protein QOE46_103 [Acidobacteriota bacterium]|jgi:hypothetical protein|nr:hypothetical protein [Acidobacteriota bacterium]